MPEDEAVEPGVETVSSKRSDRCSAAARLERLGDFELEVRIADVEVVVASCGRGRTTRRFWRALDILRVRLPTRSHTADSGSDRRWRSWACIGDCAACRTDAVRIDIDVEDVGNEARRRTLNRTLSMRPANCALVISLNLNSLKMKRQCANSCSDHRDR